MPANVLIGTALHNLGTADTALTTGITASADELNILDGATLSVAELNTLTGITATVEELNLLAGAGAAVASGTQVALLADAAVDYEAGDLDTEAEIITALNATNGKINSIIDALIAFGIMAAE